MTKQEEIREGIAHLIAQSCYKYFKERTKAINNADYFSNFNAMLEADDALSCLNDNGVVIKVDGELPKGLSLYIEDGIIKQYVPKLPDAEQPQARYVAVEPLIKEVNNG